MKTAILDSCLLASAGPALNHASTSVTTSTKHLFSLSAVKRTNLDKPVAPVYVVVDKSNYEMYVYDAKGWFATYPVVFGNSTLDDKKMEGDRNTPEGSFR